MGDTQTLHSRFGPVYLDEFNSVEVRGLSPRARELWTALSFRTRSSKGGPAAGRGFHVSYSSLSHDLSRVERKEGAVRLVPVAKKTIQRAMRQLEAAGLVFVTYHYRKPPRVVMLRPPSICERCAGGTKCLHRRSKFFSEISPGLSTPEKTVSTQSGQTELPLRVDTLSVHTPIGSEIDQSIYHCEGKKGPIENSKLREETRLALWEQMKGSPFELDPGSSWDEVRDAFNRFIVWRHPSGNTQSRPEEAERPLSGAGVSK
jgi:hypothetical protein